MIEATGVVVAVENSAAWVETARNPACGRCAAHGSCGTSVLAKLFAHRRARIRVEDTFGVSVGEAVVLGLREEALLRASFLVYGVPSLALGASAAGAAALGLGDGYCVLAGLAGLASGLILMGRIAKRADASRHAPVLLARGNEGRFFGEPDQARVKACADIWV